MKTPRPTLATDAARHDLAALLAEAGGDAAVARGKLVGILRGELDAGRRAAKSRLEAGAGGLEIARQLAAMTDGVLATLWEFTTRHVFAVGNPTEGERVALLAVGGYGRGVMAPYSDVDLLFLRSWKETPYVESVIEFMLYGLWDLGLKVGWASRTVDESLKLAREDLTIRTTLLEARLLVGDAGLAADLRKRFRAEVVKGGEREFVAEKLAERDRRHARAGASRYLVEPNVKDGKGGLRDLNTLFWIAQYLKPADAPAEIVGLKSFTPRELRGFERAFDFLWAVRAHLHFARNRAEERLSFDLQPEIAARMGFHDRDGQPAPDRFMRRYFLTAKEVGALTRAFCAKLEADQTKAPQPLARLLGARGRSRRKLDVPGFLEESGRLTVEGPKVFERDPANLLRLFRLADIHDLDLHPDAFTAVTRSLHLITPSLRRSPEAVKAFLDVLARGRRPYRTLGLMNDAGVLGRWIPEFGRIVARMQFGMRHAYTVDEHTLQAVGVIHDIEEGRLEEDHPLSTGVMGLIADKEALYLAMLLHDLGKGGAAGQEKDGAVVAQRVCERMGLDRGRADTIAWLVRNHLMLSHYAQKRDVSDPDTVAGFVRLVETPERLRMLLILTVADIRAVGPGVWNGWKGQLMRELFTATEAVFRGGRDADPATSFRRRQNAQADAARIRLVELEPEAAGFAAEMDDAYFTSFSDAEHAAHAELAALARERGGAAAIALPRDDQPALELVVAARDRRGLFADLAEALASIGGDVVGARAFTSAAGQALDVFFVQDATGAPFGHDRPADVARAAERLEAAARGERTPLPADATAPPSLRRAGPADAGPKILVDNDTSAAATVVEVSGRDRPGFLAATARALTQARLSIQSAHVDCYGERAVDAFYVLDEEGEKVRDGRRLFAIRSALARALAPGETPPNRPTRPRAAPAAPAGGAAA